MIKGNKMTDKIDKKYTETIEKGLGRISQQQPKKPIKPPPKPQLDNKKP